MNTAIDFDFLSPAKSHSLKGWVILLLGLGVMAWQGNELRTTQQASAHVQDSINAAMRRARASQQEQKLEAEPTPAERAEITQARAASTQLNYPWDAVFDAIEKAQHPDVALLSIDPKSKTGQIRLTAEAKDAAAMTSYIANLQHSPMLGRALLTSHQMQIQQPGTPLRFQVLAQWKGNAPVVAEAPSIANLGQDIVSEKGTP
jgi:Tfp pilus assembly protein PilN